MIQQIERKEKRQRLKVYKYNNVICTELSKLITLCLYLEMYKPKKEFKYINQRKNFNMHKLICSKNVVPAVTCTKNDLVSW